MNHSIKSFMLQHHKSLPKHPQKTAFLCLAIRAARAPKDTDDGGSKQKQPIMIATDVAARGLDFTGHVSLANHFILA